MKITTPGRTLVFLSVLTLCVFVSSASSAQTLDHAAATSSTMKAEVSDSMRAEILALDDRLTEIYKRSDWPVLAKLVAPDYLTRLLGWLLQSGFLDASA
jgi:hypothetical protein